MNKEKQQQAKELYFQTDLTKTQIAKMLSISRRSLQYWIRDNNWERLKLSATHLPAMLAENGYLLIAQQQRHLLSENRIMQPITHQEADTLYKLTLCVKKLKNHSTLNEGMEMFAHFIERVSKKAPELVAQITPFIEEHIENWASITLGQFKPDDLNDMGYFPAPNGGNYTPDGEGLSEAFKEQQLDRADIMAWEYEEELQQRLRHFEQKQEAILNDPEATAEDKQQNETTIQYIKSQIRNLPKDEQPAAEQAPPVCHPACPDDFGKERSTSTPTFHNTSKDVSQTQHDKQEEHSCTPVCHPACPDDFGNEGRNATRTEQGAQLNYFEKNGHSSRTEHFRSFGPDAAEIKRRKQLMDEVSLSLGEGRGEALKNCVPAQKVRNSSGLNH